MENDILYEAVRKYAARLLSDSQMAQDIAQEVFLRKNAASTPPVNLRAWVYRTARNLVIDHYRKSSRTAHPITLEIELDTLPDHTTQCNPTVMAEQKELIEMLHERINELSPRHREVLRLKFQEGLKYAEIAEVMNESITTVGWLIHEAILQLRTSFP